MVDPEDSIAKAYGKNVAAPSASCTRNAKEHAKRIIEHMVADLICKSKRPRKIRVGIQIIRAKHF